MERVKGIEPSCSAWEAGALPLCYTRMISCKIPPVDRIFKSGMLFFREKSVFGFENPDFELYFTQESEISDEKI